VILREGKTPGGTEVCTIPKHVVGRFRRHWSNLRIRWRGNSHYGRPEAMDWCEANGVDYVFGLAGKKVLRTRLRAVADDLCARRAESGTDKRLTWTETRYAAKSLTRERRVVARLEAALCARPGRKLHQAVQDLWELIAEIHEGAPSCEPTGHGTGGDLSL
jgi:hypothetical protein